MSKKRQNEIYKIVRKDSLFEVYEYNEFGDLVEIPVEQLLPFKDFYKTKSIEGEIIFTPSYFEPQLGPFRKIDKEIIKYRTPVSCSISAEDTRHYTNFTCYFAYNKDGLLVYILHEKHFAKESDLIHYKDTVEVIYFRTPIRKAKFIDHIQLRNCTHASSNCSFCDSTIAIWKLTYCDDSTKILCSALSSDIHGYDTFDLSKYI